MPEINEDLIYRYTHGLCGYLARALHEQTGWRLATLEWGDHIFVVMPDDRCLDIEGICSQEDMLTRWGRTEITIYATAEDCKKGYGWSREGPELDQARLLAPTVLALVNEPVL